MGGKTGVCQFRIYSDSAKSCTVDSTIIDSKRICLFSWICSSATGNSKIYCDHKISIVDSRISFRPGDAVRHFTTNAR